MSISLGVVPAEWKLANITPVQLSRSTTVLFLYFACYPRLNRSSTWHHSSTICNHDLLECVASGKEVDTIFLDLCKAFDKVPHNLLLQTLGRFGIDGSLLSWFRSFLTDRKQRVVLHVVCSDWLPVTSGLPQGSILGPLLFLVYCNDAQDYVQANSTLELFANDSKLYRSLDLPNSSTSLQHDLNGLQNWSAMKMKFNTDKCKAMHISRKNLKIQTPYHLDCQQLEQVSDITDLGITVSKKKKQKKETRQI